MDIRLLTGNERFQARLIATVAFHMRMEDPEKARLESESETKQHWGAFDDGNTLMAHIINNQFISFLDGKQVRCGGIGAVSTLPEYRATGAVREIFKVLIPYAYADGEVLSALYPFNHAFYRKFGYETACWKNVYEFSPGVLQGYRFSGRAVLWKTGDPVAPWTELYNRFASRFNLAFSWDEQRTADHLKGEYYKDRKFCYLLYLGDQPVASLIFQDIRHDPAAILEVQQLAWEGRDGFEAVLGFLARFTADYGTVRLFLPRDVELMSLVRSPHAYDIEKTTRQDYMVRVVNAVKALEAIRKPAGCRFIIRISDHLVPENNGTWAVTEQNVIPADDPPDLAVSEQAFAQLAVGAVSLQEALLREDTVLYGNRKTLEQVFVRKPILVEDHF